MTQSAAVSMVLRAQTVISNSLVYTVSIGTVKLPDVELRLILISELVYEMIVIA